MISIDGNEIIDFESFASTDIETKKQLNQNQTSISANRNTEELKSKNQTIPTAIVKPKYQKSSFDDRQLPVILSSNRDQPWYDKQNNDVNKCLAAATTTTTTATAPNTKKIHLPEFDRKAKKHVKQSNSNSINSSKSAHHASEIEQNKCSSKQHIARDDTTAKPQRTAKSGEKDIDCSAATASRSSGLKLKSNGASIAIVQPRKKERMDERKLMETIVQMQIKKNSMDYGNRNNNNNVKSAIKPAIQTSDKQHHHSGSAKQNINNNNVERNTSSMANNQTKKDQKDNSGKIDLKQSFLIK